MARPVVERREAVSPWPFIGMSLLAADLFLYGAAALVAAWWAVVLLVLVWLVGFLQACLWWSSHPRRITALAAAMAVLWFAVLVGGAVLLDWSA